MDVAANLDKRNAVFYILLMLFLVSLVIWASPGIAESEESHYPYASTFVEKLAIKQVSIGDSLISMSIIVLGMQGQDGSNFIAACTALIKDATGDVVQSVNLETDYSKIPVNQAETTLQINLTSPLPSGEYYTVTLVTAAGSSFVSPSFTLP